MITGISSKFKLTRIQILYAFLLFTRTLLISNLLLLLLFIQVLFFPSYLSTNYINRVRILYENRGSFWIEKNIAMTKFDFDAL